jgi:RHS repeat-associated protein
MSDRRRAVAEQELRLPGSENDDIGLYCYRARYYHPGVQRFISEDPIGLFGGDTNLSGYVANSPLAFTDPLGLDAVTTAANVAAGFGYPITVRGNRLDPWAF